MKAVQDRVVVRVIPDDVVTPIAAYAALAQPQATCLLESTDGGGRLSRYSFIGTDYLATAEFEADGVYDRVRAFVEEHRVDGSDDATGGALVAFSYDAARPQARLDAREPARPAMPAAYVAIPATWLTFDHFTHTLAISTRGDDREGLERRIDSYVERLLTTRVALPVAVRVSSQTEQSLERNRYLELVEAVKRHILDGDVYQLQLGIRFAADVDGAPFDIYRALRRENPSPYMFFVDAAFGQLLGASPEFLVRLEHRMARIRPLAGTRPRGIDERDDERIAAELLENEKERAEHVMLADLARNDLGAVCEYGSVRVAELMQIERYSHVMHIVSDLVGRLRDDCDALDLFCAGFPAGTVTGAPKVRAMQLIDGLEPVPRGFYAGSVGRWAFNGDFDSCITIRSMHVKDGRAWWQASAGIVADSNPMMEYEEVLHKTRIVRRILGSE
jgi:anthranilate synthase component I